LSLNFAETLRSDPSCLCIIADTGSDADRIVAVVRARNMKPVTHYNPTRKCKRRLTSKLYRIRYYVELFIHRIKRFRAVATRYDKTARATTARSCSLCVPSCGSAE
jgi:transposase